MITDCHIHISPLEMFKPQALELMKAKRPNFEQIAEFCRSPKAFLKYLDACGIDRAISQGKPLAISRQELNVW